MRLKPIQIILPLMVVLSFALTTNVFGQGKIKVKKTQKKTTKVVKKSTKSKPVKKVVKTAKKIPKSKPVKHMGKEFKKIGRSVKKEL